MALTISCCLLLLCTCFILIALPLIFSSSIQQEEYCKDCNGKDCIGKDCIGKDCKDCIGKDCKDCIGKDCLDTDRNDYWYVVSVQYICMYVYVFVCLCVCVCVNETSIKYFCILKCR